MGALHAGHMALIAEAQRRAHAVAATIFVNPKQFGPNEDLARYPRQETADAAMLTEGGCDLLWLPDVEDIYPDGFATSVSVAGVSERWEGAARPGHFDGVATVVARLLLTVRPDLALFGEKDFQQLAVIRRMAADLHIGVEIVGVPTVREDDGLALSSRNRYLTPEQRGTAATVHRALRAGADAGSSGADSVLTAAREVLATAPELVPDYLELTDPDLGPAPSAGPARLLLAARAGSTRLLDNVPVTLGGPR